MIYYWQLMQSRSVSTQWWVTETALEDQEGMLSLKELSSWSRQNVALYGWAGISADGEIWSMHKSDTWCTVGERGGQRAEEIFFMFKSFILPNFIKYEYDIIISISFTLFPPFSLRTWVQSHFSHVQLCVTLWAIARQVPLSMRFFQARILEWVRFPPGGLPDPGIEPEPLMSLPWHVGSLPLSD